MYQQMSKMLKSEYVSRMNEMKKILTKTESNILGIGLQQVPEKEQLRFHFEFLRPKKDPIFLSIWLTSGHGVWCLAIL